MTDHLVASYWTLAGASFGEPARWGFARRVRAAAEAGFWGIGLHYEDYLQQREAGLSDEEMLRALEAHGMVLDEIEFLTGWSSDSEAVRRQALLAEETLYRLADAVGVRQLNVGCPEGAEVVAPVEVLAERFAGVCRRAEQHGLVVALEFMPWSGVSDITTACRVVETAGQPNGGVLLDSWHFFRGGGDLEVLRSVPAARIVGVQLSDGPRVAEDDLRQEARFSRLLPGEGDFALTGLVRTLGGMGVDAPWAVEVMSKRLAAAPSVGEAAKVSFGSAERVLNLARGV